MKNRNLITSPNNTYLNSYIIYSILNFANTVKPAEISKAFSKKLNDFSYVNDSFVDLAVAIREEDQLFLSFNLLMKSDPDLLLNIIKNKFAPDTSTNQTPPKPVSHRKKIADIDQSDSDEEDSDNAVVKPAVPYHQALTFSLALAYVYLTHKSATQPETGANIHAILKSIVHIIQDNPEWKDSKTQKALFVEAVEFIISKMSDNQLIAKLVNWITPSSQKNASQAFQFLHEQKGMISRTFTASYVKIVDCAKNKIIENANHQTQAPDAEEEKNVKSILRIETGVGKHAPNFFNHQPKHLQQYEKIISEKKSEFSNKPEH